MWFRLALALGSTVAELQLRMSSHEFAEWRAYAQIEPFGQDRSDLGAAIVAATIANVNRAENQPPFSPKDFLPDFEPREPQTWEAQLSLIEVLNAAFGGKDERTP